MLKKLTHKNRNRKREFSGNGVKVSVKDILRWDSSKKLGNGSEKLEENNLVEMRFSCSCNRNNRRFSTIWSESNEENSLDLETSLSVSSISTTCHYEDEDSQQLDLIEVKENDFCNSPFHFVLQKSPSSGHRTPDFSSPATSPVHQQIQDNVNYGDSLKKFQSQEEEEEEEKEQFSPVSVLDAPFEGNHGHDEYEVDSGSLDLECSYAIVQRAKHHLLHKLRRFEKLAQLDPIELEKRLLEDEDENDDDNYDLEGLEEEQECHADECIKEVLRNSGFHNVNKLPADMKRLVSDLIAEEERDVEEFDEEDMWKRVCRRLDSWKEVKPNTIDMMVEVDFRRELEVWKKNQEQVGETAAEIELAILGSLVEELSEELICLSGIDVTTV